MRAPEPLVSSLANDPEMGELIDLFLAELPERVAALGRAAGAGDIQTVARLSHQLRGAAGGYGFPTIGQAAGAVENTVRAKASDTDRMLTRLTESVGELRALCERAMAGRRN